jgi:hypothetical protein
MLRQQSRLRQPQSSLFAIRLLDLSRRFLLHLRLRLLPLHMIVSNSVWRRFPLVLSLPLPLSLTLSQHPTSRVRRNSAHRRALS